MQCPLIVVVHCTLKRRSLIQDFVFSAYKGVQPHRHQAKVLKYPLNENFFSLHLVILRSQLIFLFWGCLLFLS
ncbi:hypothetical protein COM18_24685 [Bacillus pseudomycoides]|nr:hypothetical protein COM18_24685 [Bacillus pseudomycoides]